MFHCYAPPYKRSARGAAIRQSGCLCCCTVPVRRVRCPGNRRTKIGVVTGVYEASFGRLSVNQIQRAETRPAGTSPPDTQGSGHRARPDPDVDPGTLSCLRRLGTGRLLSQTSFFALEQLLTVMRTPCRPCAPGCPSQNGHAGKCAFLSVSLPLLAVRGGEVHERIIDWCLCDGPRKRLALPAGPGSERYPHEKWGQAPHVYPGNSITAVRYINTP